MLSTVSNKFKFISIGLVAVAAIATVVAFALDAMSLPLAIVSLVAQLASIGIQLLASPSSSAQTQPIEQTEDPTPSQPEVAVSSGADAPAHSIAEFLDANLKVLDGDIRASVPYPQGVRSDEKETVKSFVKRLRLAARELHVGNTVTETAEQDVVSAHTDTVPSSVIGLARELDSQIQKGNGAIRHGQESIRELRDLLMESSSRLRRIRDHSRSVRDGVELVKDLSEQTNVLALNAAIQASRSGEDGLSVVAEELQRVAVRGADSGRKLEEQLEALRDDLSDTMATITRSEQGVATTMQSQEAVQDAYKVISKTSSDIASKARSSDD